MYRCVGKQVIREATADQKDMQIFRFQMVNTSHDPQDPASAPVIADESFGIQGSDLDYVVGKDYDLTIAEVKTKAKK